MTTAKNAVFLLFFLGGGGVILFFSGGEIKIWYVGSLLGGLVTGVEGGLPPSHQ